MAPRTILHVDMDAFFVSVELSTRPELRGHPVVVGGTGPRGVVASASYEARARGVRSAMPTVTARRLCPDAVFLDGRLGRYAEVSARIMAIFGRFTPLVEPLSLDEAFLDVTAARRAVGDATTIAAAIRSAVRDEEGLECSIGVAPNKFVAKLATEGAKPTPSRGGPVAGPGVHVVEPDRVEEYLHSLPIGAIWGVGPAARAKLARLGIATVAQCARLDRPTLVAVLGEAHGRHLHDLCRGIDDRPVVPDLQAKSVGHEQTFVVDLTEPGEIDSELVRLADAVSIRLRGSGLAARVITVKVRDPAFDTVSRSVTVPTPIDDGDSLAGLARRLVSTLDLRSGVRLLGVSTSGLVDAGAPRQLAFDVGGPARSDVPDLDERERARLSAVDEIRARFGPDAIGRARHVRPGAAGASRPGEQPWGPSDRARD